MKTIAVFGNSSSILKDGWVSYLKINHNYKIINNSLGGSPTPANIYQLINNFDLLKEADFILLAPTIDWRLGEKTEGANELIHHINFFIRKVASLRLPIIYVDQPQPDNLYELPLSSEIWRFFVKKNGGFIVDLFHVFRKVLNLNGGFVFSNFFRDDRGHLDAQTSAWVANYFNDLIVSINSSLVYNSKMVIDVIDGNEAAVNYSEDYFIIKAKDIVVVNNNFNSDISLTKRKSSLGDFEVLPIAPNNEYQLSVGSNFSVIGALWNYGQISPVRGKRIMWKINSKTELRSHGNKYLPDKILNKPLLIFEAFKSKIFSEIGLLSFNLVDHNDGEDNIELSGFLLASKSDQFIENNINLFINNSIFHFAENQVNKTINTLLSKSENIILKDEKKHILENKKLNLNKQNDIIDILKNIALSFEKNDSIEFSIRTYELILLIKPDAYWVRFKVAQFYYDKGDFDLARRFSLDLSNSPDFKHKQSFLEKIKNIK